MGWRGPRGAVPYLSPFNPREANCHSEPLFPSLSLPRPPRFTRLAAASPPPPPGFAPIRSPPPLPHLHLHDLTATTASPSPYPPRLRLASMWSCWSRKSPASGSRTPPPPSPVKSNTGYGGVRLRKSGRCAAEITLTARRCGSAHSRCWTRPPSPTTQWLVVRSAEVGD